MRFWLMIVSFFCSANVFNKLDCKIENKRKTMKIKEKSRKCKLFKDIYIKYNLKRPKNVIQQQLHNISYIMCTINRTPIQVQYYNIYTYPVYSTQINYTHSNKITLQSVK